MALVHSRIRRVFYGVRDRAKGGLGSAAKIHCIRSLNHHYLVFAGLLEEECSLLYRKEAQKDLRGLFN